MPVSPPQTEPTDAGSLLGLAGATIISLVGIVLVLVALGLALPLIQAVVPAHQMSSTVFGLFIVGLFIVHLVVPKA